MSATMNGKPLGFRVGDAHVEGGADPGNLEAFSRACDRALERRGLKMSYRESIIHSAKLATAKKRALAAGRAAQRRRFGAERKPTVAPTAAAPSPKPSTPTPAPMNTIAASTVGPRLMKASEALGWRERGNIAKLCQGAGISRSILFEADHGKRISHETLRKLTDFLGLRDKWVLTGEGEQYLAADGHRAPQGDGPKRKAPPRKTSNATREAQEQRPRAPLPPSPGAAGGDGGASAAEHGRFVDSLRAREREIAFELLRLDREQRALKELLEIHGSDTP